MAEKYYYVDLPYSTVLSDGRFDYIYEKSKDKIIEAAPDKLVMYFGEDGYWPEPDADPAEGKVYQKGSYTKAVYVPATGWLLEQFENAESLF